MRSSWINLICLTMSFMVVLLVKRTEWTDKVIRFTDSESIVKLSQDQWLTVKGMGKIGRCQTLTNNNMVSTMCIFYGIYSTMPFSYVINFWKITKETARTHFAGMVLSMAMAIYNIRGSHFVLFYCDLAMWNCTHVLLWFGNVNCTHVSLWFGNLKLHPYLSGLLHWHWGHCPSASEATLKDMGKWLI